MMWPNFSRLVTVYLKESSIRKEHTMIEIGTFHNGASDLPAVTTPDGVVVNDGSLAEVHESYQRVLVGQVRQGILAERLGFDYWFMTEHHFMPEGPEFSPNPLLAEAAIAAQTKRIRFGQMANILPCWHPIRIAEQAAMLDVISGGRLEFGIGRGYQPREAELWGWRYGSTIQDQERNRAYFE
jgi:alkanesulfonate monooxygenase SsuD/methylene tetrahydromethanopterin reductase-like flavin-dependent oxidoreductase (luciferase family)